MIIDFSPETAKTLAEYGPFAFALLFISLLFDGLRRFGNAYRNRQEAESREEPKITKEERQAFDREIRLYRWYFWPISVFVFLVSCISIWWWLTENQKKCPEPNPYAFEGVIEDLQAFQVLYPIDMYFCDDPKPGPADAPPRHDVKFVITSNKRFKEGQQFATDFYRKKTIEGQGEVIDADSRTPLFIRYLNAETKRYQLEMDDSKGELVLKPRTLIASRTVRKQEGFLTGLLIGTAHARDNKGFDPRVQSKTEQHRTKGILTLEKKQKILMNDMLQFMKHQPVLNILPLDVLEEKAKYPNIDEAIAKLRSERSSVTEKVDSLAALNKLDRSELNEKFDKAKRTKPQEEPFALTILDLTRHTDMEVSFKARVLAQKVDVKKRLTEELSKLLRAKNDSSKARAIKILKRLDPEFAMGVVKDIAAKVDNPQVAKIKNATKDPSSFRVLFPTGSTNGDRYYVKAIWKSNDEKTIDCLARLYSNTLMEGKGYDEEKKRMNGRTDRTIYWYSKDWALDIAEKIRKCGATTQFVNWKDAKY